MKERPKATAVEVEVEAAGRVFGESVKRHGTLFVLAAYDRKTKRFQCMANVPPKHLGKFLHDFTEDVATDDEHLVDAYVRAAGN